MISLIIWVLCFLIVVVIVKYIIDTMGLEPPIARIVWLVLALLFLLDLLSQLGVIHGVNLP